MFANNTQQNKSGLWVIRPRGTSESAGTVMHYELPVTISATGNIPDIIYYPPPAITYSKCETLAPITFPNEQVLDCDLTQNTLNCWFEDITINAEYEMNIYPLTWVCEPLFALAYEYMSIIFEYKDQYNRSINWSGEVAGGSLDATSHTRVGAYTNIFTIKSTNPGPIYLGAIVPKVTWVNGGGSFNLTGKIIFQYIKT